MEEENYKETNILLGILLAILIALNSLAILFIIGVSKVNAETSPTLWYDNFKTPMYVEYWRWTSASANSNQATEEFNIVSNDQWNVGGDTTFTLNKGVKNTNAFTITNYGLTIRITTQETMKANYLYAWQIGVCSDVTLNNVNYNKVSYTLTGNEQYTYGTKINMSKDATGYLDFNSCKIYSGLVSGDSGSNNLYIKLVASTNTSSGTYYLMGYDLQELGMLDQYMFNTINNYIASQSTDLKSYMDTKANVITNLMTQQQQATQQAIQESTEEQIASQQVCQTIDKSTIEIYDKYINNAGQEATPQNTGQYGITRYINITSSTIKYTTKLNNDYVSAAFYDANKRQIQRIDLSSYNVGDTITIPSNAKYFRSSIYIPTNIPTYTICTNGNQASYNQQEEMNNQDLSEQDKQNADNTEVENYEDAEETLMSSVDTNTLNSVNIDLDFNSNNWIWNTMTSLLNSNALISTMVISILSIGVIKLVLVR